MMTKDFKEKLKIAREIEVDDQYYAESYNENIYCGIQTDFVRMFCRGGGKELLPKDGKKEKAACIYSSSMLAYNFFHWISENTPLVYDGITYDKVIFEEQFRVLKNRNNKANIDVVLISKDNKTLLLLESKFTEHLKKGDVDISSAYYDSESYFTDDGSKWTAIMKGINYENKDNYYEGLKQIACHLIGISSVLKNDDAKNWFDANSWIHHIYGLEISSFDKIIFKSIVFHPSTKQESKLTEEYKELVESFVKEINFLPEYIVCEKPFISYRDIWKDGMENSIKDKALARYLENYLKVHK